MKNCCKERILKIINKVNKLNQKTRQLQKVLDTIRIVGPDEYVGKMKRRK